MIYIFAILLAISQCYYQRYQFNDLKWDRDIRWKYWRIVSNILIYGTIMISKFFTTTWQDLLLSISIYWIVFEIGTNIISLSAKWFYVGKSSALDNNFGKYKWYLMALYLLISIIIKFLT